jgi:hypothetical protein
MKLMKWDDKSYIDMVAKSEAIKDVVLGLGSPANKSYYRLFHNYRMRLKVDTTHFKMDRLKIKRSKSDETNVRTCAECEVTKDVSLFNKKGKGFHVFCRECSNHRSKEHYLANKQYYFAKSRARAKLLREKIYLAKSDVGCFLCKETFSACLDFHHTDDDKEGSISKMAAEIGVPALLAEVTKCIILCSNCHRKLHANAITLPKDSDISNHREALAASISARFMSNGRLQKIATIAQ